MAKYSNTVEYQIRTTLDSSGIAQLKAELNGLQNALVSKNAQGLIPKETFTKTMQDIKQVETALTRAFNGKLGMLDLRKFNSELMQGGKTLNGYYQSFSRLGTQGIRAFGQMYGQMTQINTGMKQISSTTDKIMNTFGNTFRWGMIASVFSGMMNSIHKSVQYVKDLDKSLTNIQMVTASSRESMNNFAVQANEAAKKLGGTTVQMTNATEVFIRQGHSLETSTQLGEYAVHLANVSGQDSALASDEITAYMNAFKIPLEDLGNAVSKWAAVANNAAVSVEELSVASQKAAAVATTVGVDMDQFAAHIAAIEATTREAPENIGNGLKTIYSRIADVKLGETLEDGVDLGSFAKAIEKVGVEVLDQAGNLRDAGDIIQDLMGVWQDLDQTQRAALAKTVAGRFQLARFEALMNSADIYENSLKVSQAETGTDTYDRMQETYRDSMEGRLNALSATVEGIFTKAFNTDDFYGLIDAATALAETFDNLIQAIGGGNAALTALGAILTKVFANNIAQGIGNTVMNRQTNQMVSSNMNTLMANARMTAVQGGAGIDSQYMNSMTQNVAGVQRYMGSASKEQLEAIDTAVQKHISIMQEAAIAEEKFGSTLEAVEILLRASQHEVEGTGTMMERYTAIIQELANAESDTEAYTAAQNELYKALEEDAANLTTRLLELARVFEEAAMRGKTEGEALQTLRTESASLNAIVRELAESELVSSERREQLLKVSEVLTRAQQGQITSSKDLAAALDRVGLDTVKFAAALKTVGQDGVNIRQLLEQLVLQYNQLSSAAAVSTKELQGMSGALMAQNIAKNVATIASGAMNVVFAIQSVRSALEAFHNEDLDPFEQLEQGIMGISIAIAMTAPMASNLIKVIKEQLTITRLATLQTDIDTLAKQKNLVVTFSHTAGIKAASLAKIAETKEQWKHVFALMAEEKGTKQVTRSEIALIAAIRGKKAAEIEAIAVESGATIVTRTFAQAVRDLAKAFFSVLAPAAPFLAIAAAIAGTIALVAIHIKKARDEYYRFDIALEEAKDSLTAANEQLDIAKDNLEQITESLEKVKNIDDTFDNLNRGTVEWNQALVEANDNILSLIEKYPDLAQYIEHGQYGELTLTKEGQEQAQNYAQSQLEGAQVNANRAQNKVFDAERNKYLMDYVHQNASFISGRHVDYIGEGYGSSGFQVSDDAGLLDETENLVQLWKNAEGNVSAFRQALENSNRYSEEQIQAIIDNKDELQNLSEALDKNTLAQKASNKARASQLMSDNDVYQRMDSGAQNIVDATVANMMNDKTLRANYSRDFKNTYADAEAASKWAEEHGIFGEGSEYKSGKWYDETGQEIDKLNNLDEDELYDEIRESYIAQAIADNIQEHSDEIVRPIQQAFIDAQWVGGDKFANLFAGKDENGKGQFDTAGVRDFVFDKNVLEDLDLSKITDADWEELGFKNAQDFVNSLNQYLQDNPIKPNIEMPTDTTLDFQEGEISSLLDDTGVSESSLDRMSQAFYDEKGGYFQDALEDLPDKIHEVDAALNALGDRTEENAEQYDEAANKARALHDEYDNLKNESKDMAAMALRLNRGLGKLTDQWEDLSSVLTDEASEGTLEYYEALGQLDEIMSDIVNIDVGTLSDDFYQNEEAMDAMAAAATGDIDAIDTLRNLAAQDIIQHMEIASIDGADAETARAELLAIQQNLQAELDKTPLEARADIDVSEYTDKLNEMIRMGQISAEQASQALSSMGISGTMTTEKGTVSVPKISYRLTGDPQSLADGGELKIEPFSDGMMDQEVDIPQFVGTHYAGTGINHVGGGGRKGGSGGGGGGKGGGGGGKGKTYEPKKKDFEKKEKDRYEKVNTAIDKIDSSIQNLTMDQDRLIGTRWADNLKKETDLLKEQIPWYEKKLAIQKQEAKELRDQLAKNYGAAFGNNGQLQNYSQIFDRLNRELEQAYKDYNNGKTEAAQEAAEKKIQDIEKRFDTFNKIYARYDTLWSKEMPETEKALKEIQDRLEDIAEEARKARREAAQSLDEIRETEREINKTFNNLGGELPELNFNIDMGRIEELIGGEGLQNELAQWIADYEDRLAKATSKEMKDYYKKQIALLKEAEAEGGTSVLALNQQRLKEIAEMQEQWATNGYYMLDGQKSYNEQALQDMMKEALDDANDLFSNLDGAIKDAKQDIEDMSEMLDNNIQKRQDDLDAIGDKIEHIQNISELIYGDQATAQQVNLYNMQAQNEENRLKELEKERELHHQMVELRRQLAEADPENKTAQEEYLDALDKEREIDNDILDTREKIAEAYKDAKEAANDLAVDNWLNNFNGMINGVNVPLEYMADQWERIQENEDLYLDDLNKAYEIQKLQNKYQEMLNDATDPAIQQQITDQMNEQLAYLREKTNLSKYDVDYANAQLEILQKTIALEDARAAKNTMKLRRDSQGNYQYVYAADQNKTGEAENDLLDATMNAYNMSKEQQADVQDNYIKKIQDMGDALRKAANDQTLTREQIAAITQSIIDDGYEYLNAMGEQLDTSQKNMIQSFIDAAFQMQVENASAVQDIAQDLQDGITDTLDMVDDRFDTSVKFWIGDDGLGKFQDEANETRDTIVSNVWDFEAAVSDANAAIARPLNEMEDEVNDVNTSIEGMTETMGEFFDLLEQKSGSITNAADAVATLQRQLTDSKNEASEYIQELNKLNAKNKQLQATNTQLKTTIQDMKDGKSGSGAGSGAGNGTGKAVADRKAGDRTGFRGIYHENSWGQGDYGSQLAGMAGAVKISTFSKAPYGNSSQGSYGAYYVHIETPGGGPLGWIKPSQMFDTGGYTGAWGKGGRMAMLHEKELVLNADDTRNVLAAVDAVRQITEQLKGAAIGNGLVASIGRAVQNTIQGSNVEQRVEITANFPNVNSAQEIENALLGLSDTSYQYAYNKNDTPW